MTNKEQFCQYLEEVATELRASPSTREYLFDVYKSLIDHTKKFHLQEIKENHVRIIK